MCDILWKINLSFICRCQVSSAEVRQYLSTITTLETLRCYLCHISDPEDVPLTPALGKLSSLRTLVMPCQYPITKEFLGQVAQLSTLQDLDLSATYPVGLDQYPDIS